MASVAWNKLPNQAEYDRVVEAFFVKENADLGSDAYVVNGRGGDGGIDIHIRRSGRLTVVQLKFFPEGFSGGWKKTRQDQIRDSFKSALQHDPDEWWLVVPTTLTDNERKYVLELPHRQRPRLTRPTVVVFDRPMLDIIAAKHPDLVTYFLRDELLEAARTYNQETALLIDQNDLVARVAALANQADTLHPDWRLDVFTEGNITGTVLVPKHPRAAERSPITLKLKTAFGPDHDDLRLKFERAVSYGTPDRIDLPASVVSSFSVDGPSFVAQTSEKVEVSWIPATRDSVGRHFTVMFYDDRGKLVSSFPGRTTWTGRANVGASVRATFFDVVTLDFLLPFDTSAGGTMSVTVRFDGREPSDVVRAISLLQQFESACSVGLELDGAQIARLLPQHDQQSVFGEHREEFLVHRDVASDLAAVQEATSLYFTYPREVPAADRVYLRCLRLLLEGRCVVLPDFREITPTLNGRDSDGLRQLLEGEPVSLHIEMTDFALDVFDHKISVGGAQIYAPQVVAIDADDIRVALRAGAAEGRTMTMQAVEGYGFWAYLPDRLIEDPDGRLRPVGLRLPDFPDAPDVARALETRY